VDAGTAPPPGHATPKGGALHQPGLLAAALLQYADACGELLAALRHIPFNQRGGSTVLLVLGPSPLRPKEAYRILLPPCQPAPCDDAPESAQRKQHGSAVKQVLRALVMAHADIPEWDAVPGVSCSRAGARLPGLLAGPLWPPHVCRQPGWRLGGRTQHAPAKGRRHAGRAAG
jgi:hypothetical protein